VGRWPVAGMTSSYCRVDIVHRQGFIISLVGNARPTFIIYKIYQYYFASTVSLRFNLASMILKHSIPAVFIFLLDECGLSPMAQ